MSRQNPAQPVCDAAAQASFRQEIPFLAYFFREPGTARVEAMPPGRRRELSDSRALGQADADELPSAQLLQVSGQRGESGLRRGAVRTRTNERVRPLEWLLARAEPSRSRRHWTPNCSGVHLVIGVCALSGEKDLTLTHAKLE